MTDLCGLLKDAERLGFVQAGTVQGIASRATGDPEPMVKSKYFFHSSLFILYPDGQIQWEGAPNVFFLFSITCSF